jgi:AcrR family transcriptional regulator
MDDNEMSPKYVNREKKVTEIARVALELFTSRGYGATSVDQIAQASGIGKGTIYEYFDTKADIFFAAVLEWMRRLEDQFSEHLHAVDDPLDRLRLFAELSVAIVDPIDPGLARLSIDVLRHTLLKDGALYKRRHLMKEVHTGMRRIVVNILLEGISSGVFRPEIARDAEKMAINLLGYLDGISLHSLISEGDFNLREQIEFSLENILRLIVSDQAAYRIEKK